MSNPIEKLIWSMMSGIAESERSMILKRKWEGIAKAKSKERHKGRKPTAREKTSEVRDLAAQRLCMGATATKLGIGKGPVHRMLSRKAA